MSEVGTVDLSTLRDIDRIAPLEDAPAIVELKRPASLKPKKKPAKVKGEKPTTYNSDVGPFFLAPLWLVEVVSGQALKLYCLLGAKYTNTKGGKSDGAYPSRRRLAAEMGCSLDTLDRLIAELQRAGALSKKHRRGAHGDLTSNAYTLYAVRRPSRKGAATPSRKGAATWPQGCGSDPYPLIHTQTDPGEEEEEENESLLSSGGQQSSTSGERGQEVSRAGAQQEVFDGGMGDGKIRDHDFAPTVRPWGCGCRSTHGYADCHSVTRHCFDCHTLEDTHREPVYEDRWERRAECLGALGFTKEERIALYGKYGNSCLRRRYAWVLKKGKAVKNPKHYFIGSLEMPDIPIVELTEWDIKSGYGFPWDVPTMEG